MYESVNQDNGPDLALLNQMVNLIWVRTTLGLLNYARVWCSSSITVQQELNTPQLFKGACNSPVYPEVS